MRTASFWALLSIVFMLCTPVRADGIDSDAGINNLLDKYRPYLKQIEEDGDIHITAAPTPTHKANVMPDQIAWTGESISVWGNSNTTSGDYKWEFGDGADSGIKTVTDNHYIKEDHTYTLLVGVSSQVYTATLNIYEGGVLVDSDQVNITVMDKTALTPAEQLKIDVNIAIENGLEYLYLHQESDGSWYGSGYRDGPTGFAVLAFLNHGYRAKDPAADPAGITDNEIYAEYVYAGLNYLFTHTRPQTLSPQPAGDPDPFTLAVLTEANTSTV